MVTWVPWVPTVRCTHKQRGTGTKKWIRCDEFIRSLTEAITSRFSATRELFTYTRDVGSSWLSSLTCLVMRPIPFQRRQTDYSSALPHVMERDSCKVEGPGIGCLRLPESKSSIYIPTNRLIRCFPRQYHKKPVKSIRLVYTLDKGYSSASVYLSQAYLNCGLARLCTSSLQAFSISIGTSQCATAVPMWKLGVLTLSELA